MFVSQALQKKERAQVELAKINAKTNPADAPLDKEHLSDGERYMYKKLGLKMKAFLLLGEIFSYISLARISILKVGSSLYELL